MSFLFPLRTDKDVEFTGSIAQNASEQENIVLPGVLAGINGNARNKLKAIAILSDQQLAWELNLWSSDTFEESNFDNDYWLGRWGFVAGDGTQIAGAGAFMYYVDGLDVPYVDRDNTGELHVSLVNRSAGAKTAGAAGEIVVTFILEPMVTP